MVLHAHRIPPPHGNKGLGVRQASLCEASNPRLLTTTEWVLMEAAGQRKPMKPPSLRGRAPVRSDAEWGSVGYRNRWGGFHSSTDPYLYWTFLKFMLGNLFHKGCARTALHYMWDRWRHRRCDTVDFHHYACTLDKYGKKLDDDYHWRRVWADRAVSPDDASRERNGSTR